MPSGRRDVTLTGPGGGGIVHGSQITAANTGPFAYFDPGLGRLVTSGDLATVSGPSIASDFVGPGGVISRKRFLSDHRIDVPGVTYRACLLESFSSTYRNGIETEPSYMEWCAWDPPTTSAASGDLAHGSTGYTLYRCRARNFSDAFRVAGGSIPQTIVECYARVRMVNADDHNDVIQAAGASGSVRILRSNLSAIPEGGTITGGSGGPNSCVQFGDIAAGSTFFGEVTDCLLDGTGTVATLRLYDGGPSPAVTYKATGNLFVRSSSAPLDRGSVQTTPAGQVEWSNNRWADDLSLIAAP